MRGKSCRTACSMHSCILVLSHTCPLPLHIHWLLSSGLRWWQCLSCSKPFCNAGCPGPRSMFQQQFGGQDTSTVDRKGFKKKRRRNSWFCCLSCGSGNSTGPKMGFWLLWSGVLLSYLWRLLIGFYCSRMYRSSFVCKQSWPLLNSRLVCHQSLSEGFW